jgi:4-amino-4-deoxychorismate lyase
MCLLLETIKVRKNMLENLEFHTERVNCSRHTLFNFTDVWDLSQLISIPDLDTDIIYRCRLLYSRRIEQTEFHEYIPRIIRKLFLVPVDDLEYAFKYANRDALNTLRDSKTKEQDSDILIVKNGYITDTSFSNIAFFDGISWFTPAIPLLQGTKRAYYLKKRLISECHITPADLHIFQKARLINAMLDLEDGKDLRIEDIIR